jgi:hypothetical protein
MNKNEKIIKKIKTPKEANDIIISATQSSFELSFFASLDTFFTA